MLVKVDHDGIFAPGQAQMLRLRERQRKTLANLSLRE